MAGASPEHSTVIVNFVAAIRKQLKKVEIYELDYENDIPQYFLWKEITVENKEEMQMIHFPNIQITFDELFEEIE